MHNSEPPAVGNYKKSLYKTEICDTWKQNNGRCKYGDRCKFAHGAVELCEVPRHPKYKTQHCFKYYVHGVCPYGTRCNFLHDDHEKLYTVKPPHKVGYNDLFSSCPGAAMSNLNVNAPIFTPRKKTNGEEKESTYAESNYTDSFEMFHDVLSDSGFEQSALSDSEIEPFIRGGFTDAKTFLKQHQDLCNNDDGFFENSGLFDLNSPGTFSKSRYKNDRLPFFFHVYQ